MKVVIAATVVFLFAIKFCSQTCRAVVSNTDLLDSGWQYGLARLPDWGFSCGKDTFFTYGPLASKVPFLVASGNLSRESALHLRYGLVTAAIYLFYLWCALTLYRIHPAYLVVAVAAFLLNPFPEGINDSFLYAMIGLLGVIFYGQCKEGSKTGRLLVLFAYAILSGAALLYKVSWGLPAFLTPILFAFLAILKRDRLFLCWSLIAFLLATLLLLFFYFGATGGSFPDLFSFLVHSAEQCGLYSQVMAVEPYKLEPALFAGIIISTLIVLSFLYQPSRTPLLLVLPTLFASFKAGFVRADIHMAFFFHSVTLLLLSIPLSARGEKMHTFLERQNVTRHALPLAVMLLVLTLTFWANKILFHSSGLSFQKGIQMATTYSRWGREGYLREKIRESDDNLKAISEIFAPDIRKKVEGQKVAIIPFALPVPDALGAKMVVFPSLQFYSGYTKRLDEANLKLLKSLSKETYLLMRFDSVDCRYPLHDCPRTYEWLLANYQVVNSASGYLLLARKEKPTKIVAREPVFVGKGRWEYPLPPLERENVETFERLMVRGLVGIKYSLVTFLLRGPALFLEMELSDGKRCRFRTFPEFLERGVWLSPFFRSDSDLQLWMEGNGRLLAYPVRIRIVGQGRGYFSKPAVWLQRCSIE